jgi:hypothetical protein
MKAGSVMVAFGMGVRGSGQAGVCKRDCPRAAPPLSSRHDDFSRRRHSLHTEQAASHGHKTAAHWRIGIIGGSGIYDLSVLDEVQEIAVQSPFGAPSGPVTLGGSARWNSCFWPAMAPGTAFRPKASTTAPISM